MNQYSSDEDEFEPLPRSSQQSDSPDDDHAHSSIGQQVPGLVDGCVDAAQVRDKGRLRTVAFTDAEPQTLAMRTKITEALTRRSRIEPANSEKPAVDPRPWQIATAAELLLGRDTIVVTATGSGKTMCFFLALFADVKASVLVVSPLLALMDDQVKLLLGIPEL
jgi:superfamily II RNA helicase